MGWKLVGSLGDFRYGERRRPISHRFLTPRGSGKHSKHIDELAETGDHLGQSLAFERIE